MTDSRITVAVLFGGRSSEHSVSCVSGTGIIGALDPEKHRALPIGITEEGTWRTVEDLSHFTFAEGQLPKVEDNGTSILVSPSTVGPSLIELSADGTTRDLGRIDVFFPVLHGQYGEDGTLQGLLEHKGAAFVGPGVYASAAGMDKHFMKTTLAGAGIPTVAWETVGIAQWKADPEAVAERVGALGFPVFVKPARAGSSVGISRVTGPEGLAAAMDEAFAHDPKVVVEPGVDGREIECAVLGSIWDDELVTSAPGEIIITGDHDFYDFDAKYLDAGAVHMQAPAELPADVTARVRELAAQAFRAFECTGLTRVDTFVTADGEVLINEINTAPGFTPSSGYPQMMRASGVDMRELVSRLIDIALADAARRTPSASRG